jgi:transposase-like protein
MRKRSSHPETLKAQVLQECLKPGASISRVAIRNIYLNFEGSVP